MVLFAPIDDLLDTMALALVQEPRETVYGLPRDADIAIATRVSRFAFKRGHTRAGARALLPLIDAAQHHDPQVITSRQLHVLIGIAAADLLERQHLGAFLESYVDPGVAVTYQPISVTTLRRTLHEVFERFEHPRRRARLIMSLAAHSQDELVRRTASDTPFTIEFLRSRAGHAKPEIRSAVARNHHCDAELLEHLSADPNADVRLRVACNPNAPTHLLAMLANDGDRAVQRGVAENLKTDSATLATLADHDHDTVRATVARHPHTDANVLASLAQDRNPSVRIAVAMSPRASAELLSALAHDAHATVRNRALRNPTFGHSDGPAVDGEPASAAPGQRASGAVVLIDGSAMDPREHAPAIARLAIAASALRAGARMPASDVRDVATLPTLEDRPFPTARAAQARFAGAPITLRVLADGHEQRQNGIAMDNCTLAPDKIQQCHDGAYVLAVFTVEGEPYNIAWRHDGTTWICDGLAGKRNAQAPPAVRALAEELTPLLDGLAPEPRLTVASDAVLAELVLTASSARRNRGLGPASLARA